ncbi:MAG: hypothetical protein R3B47_15390 [Bacteroidia bacterium]
MSCACSKASSVARRDLDEAWRYAVAPDRVGELQALYPQLKQLTIGYTEPDSAGRRRAVL